MLFQNPYASLEPCGRVKDLLAESLKSCTEQRGRALMDRLIELSAQVGLDTTWIDRFPRQFFGSQRQRIAIARALATRPKLLMADEPVSSLDVPRQAQGLALLRHITVDEGPALLFISHEMSVVDHLYQTVGKQSPGRLKGCGPVNTVFRGPRTDYTSRLIAAIPGKRCRALQATQGEHQ